MGDSLIKKSSFSACAGLPLVISVRGETSRSSARFCHFPEAGLWDFARSLPDANQQLSKITTL